MCPETLTYVFQVNYEDGKVSFIRIDGADDARDYAWRIVHTRMLNKNAVRSVEFLHIERKY